VRSRAGLGAPPHRVLSSVVLPLMAPAALATAALLFALSAGELPVSLLVSAPGGQTLPRSIFSLMHIGMTHEVGALLLLADLVAVAVVRWVSGAAAALVAHGARHSPVNWLRCFPPVTFGLL